MHPQWVFCIGIDIAESIGTLQFARFSGIFVCIRQLQLYYRVLPPHFANKSAKLKTLPCVKITRLRAYKNIEWLAEEVWKGIGPVITRMCNSRFSQRTLNQRKVMSIEGATSNEGLLPHERCTEAKYIQAIYRTNKRVHRNGKLMDPTIENPATPS